MANFFIKRRNALELTQEEIAEQVGCTFQAVGAWEREVSSPDIAIAEKLAAVYRVSMPKICAVIAGQAASVKERKLRVMNENIKA